MARLHHKFGWIIDQLQCRKVGAALETMRRKNIRGISTDSRTIEPGEVFFALKGDNFDGHQHIGEALGKGAVAAVAEKTIRGRSAEQVLVVGDTLSSLGDLAGAILRKQGIKVVAVTGSNGKTTTKEMIAAIVRKRDQQALITQGNYNNLIGLPLTVFQLARESRLAVLEMGMSGFGEIARLVEIAEPDVGLITSVGAAHLEFFGKVSEVAKAKGEMYAGLKQSAIAVVNLDEALLVREAGKFSGNKLTFGFSGKADIRLGALKDMGLKGQRLTIFGPGSEKGIKVDLALLGGHNAHNALAASAAALAAGSDWNEIKQGLEDVKPVPGRLMPQKTAGGIWLIDDSYNANPASMAAGLRVLASLKSSSYKGAILGDMLELGEKSDRLHREIGSLAGELKLDFLALVGSKAELIGRAAAKAGLNLKMIKVLETPEEAAEWSRKVAPKNSLILVKGSNGVGLKRAVASLRVS